MLLDGRVAIVTGGTRGIGGRISRVLAGHGASVAAIYHQDKTYATDTVEDIVTSGGTAEAFQADVRDEDAVRGMVEAAVDRFGRIDGLVNNAIGGRQHAPFDEAAWDDYLDMFDYGCRAVINTIRAVRPVMREQGGGRVVNIVTELWNMGTPEWSTYLAGKGAMVGLSRSLANELGPEGITVNMVAPGWMATDRIDTESEASRSFAQSLPLRRHGSADEIGKACVFFLSDLAGYITGAYLPVTGGRITQMGS